MIGPRVWTITKKIKWGDKIDGLNPLDENLTSHKTFISTIYLYEIFLYEWIQQTTEEPSPYQVVLVHYKKYIW